MEQECVMKNREIYEKIKRIVPKDRLLIDEPMKNHTAFKIGGPVDLMVLPKKRRRNRKNIESIGQQ